MAKKKVRRGSVKKRVKRKSAKRVAKKRVKRKKPDDKYMMEPKVIKLPKGEKTHRTEAILICPKCKSENIRVIDYQGIRCVVCRDCKFDERDVYDVPYTERTVPKVKAVFKAGGHLRTVKKRR